MRDVLTIVGASVVFLSGIPYILDIIKKKTRPNIVSWSTWTVLITIGAFAALDAHETRTAIITFGDATQCLIVVLLALRYGYAKFSMFDGVCQLGAVLGFAMLFVFHNPTTAIMVTVGIDLVASLPTYRHSWLLPNEETWQTFALSSIGAVIGLTSIASYTFDSLAYPSYLVLVGATMAGTIVLSRKRKALPIFR